MSRVVILAGAIGFAGMVALSSLGGPPPRGKGVRNLLCGAPFGPSKQKVPDTFSAQEPDDSDDDSAMIDPLGPNAACYVCHMTFVYEELSNVHLPEKITCVRCHGLSAAHANDEKIGATLPDITFKRDKIDAACSTADCHKRHDVPARKIIARWLERKRPKSPAVCTDCHGMHKIERPEESDESDPGLAPAGTPST